MTLIGYMRVSTEDQNHDLQYDALVAAGVKPKNIYKDVMSGKTTRRDGLDTALKQLKSKDTLVVWKLDRLGRKPAHLYMLIDGLNDEDKDFKSITEGFDTTTAGGRFMFGVMSSLAEMERNLISERTKAGMAAAKARGAKIGRPPKVPYKKGSIVKMLKSGKSYRDVAALSGISKSTVARIGATIKEK